MKSVVDFLYAHNQPEPCLDPECAFCKLWDNNITEEFAKQIVDLLPMQTEVIQ